MVMSTEFIRSIAPEACKVCKSLYVETVTMSRRKGMVMRETGMVVYVVGGGGVAENVESGVEGW